jgi:hypothetical protein
MEGQQLATDPSTTLAIVQSVAMVVLVGVTAYYAYSTKRMADIMADQTLAVGQQAAAATEQARIAAATLMELRRSELPFWVDTRIGDDEITGASLVLLNDGGGPARRIRVTLEPALSNTLAVECEPHSVEPGGKLRITFRFVHSQSLPESRIEVALRIESHSNRGFLDSCRLALSIGSRRIDHGKHLMLIRVAGELRNDAEIPTV